MLSLWEILIWLVPPAFVSLILLDQYLHRGWLLATAGSMGLVLLTAAWQTASIWWAPLVLLAGVILCLLEFIIPGFSFAGVLGILAHLAGLYLVTDGHLFPVRLILILLPLAIIPLLNRRLGHPTVIPDHMVHTTVNDVASGFVAHTTHSELIDHEGKALTALHPSGLAQIDGQRVDVICTTPYLPAGSPIRVRAVSPGRVEVEPIE